MEQAAPRGWVVNEVYVNKFNGNLDELSQVK